MLQEVLANRYRVIKKLGEGGMGTVYQVEDTVNSSIMAFKILSKNIADSNDTLLQFKQEFRVMNKLKHPNTVSVYDYGLMPDKSPYLTMEVVPGNELSDLKNLSYDDIVKILIQIAQALNFIHSRLLVHCDIKPQNIRMKEDGTVKLMDFGLMNQLGIRSNGQITGTVDYLPPEIPTGGIINESSDLYSVGVVIYELVTGTLPFKGNSILEVIRSHINTPVEPPRNIKPDIPEKLEKIILKLLEKKQIDRYKDCSELIKDLSDISDKNIDLGNVEQKISYLNSSLIVARDEELKVLEDSLKYTKNSSARAVFIGAPAGIGKSRLIQEFKLQVQLAEITFIAGHCFEQGMSAYKPMADAFKQLLPLTLEEELNKYGNILVKIIPDLKEKGFEPLENLEGISEKLRLFDTIISWLSDISNRETIVIFIDDLHWVDQASIDLLNTCIRDLKKNKIMFLGTFRDDEAPLGHPIWQTIDEKITKLLKLEPFTLDNIKELIKAMLGSIELKKDFIEKIKDATSGNAFFISELMRYLIEENILELKYGTWFISTENTDWELPNSIEATVTRRLKTLSDKSLNLIKLAAVAGRKLRLSLFKAVSNYDEEEIFNSIDELVERQFLNKFGNEYIFPHDRVRETLYDGLDNLLRKELHFEIAETIEKENINSLINVSGELAYHYSKSTNIIKAIKYLLIAGFSSPVRMDSSKLIKEANDLLEKEENISNEFLREYLSIILNKKDIDTNVFKEIVLENSYRKLAWISYMIAPKICLDTSEKLINFLENKGFDINTTAEFESIRASSYTMMGQNEKAFSITDPIIDNPKFNNTLVRAFMLFGRLNGMLTTGKFRQLTKDMEEAVDIMEKNFDKLEKHLIWPYGFSSFIREDAVAWLGKKLDINSKYFKILNKIAKEYNHLDLEFWSYYPEVVRNSLIGKYYKIKEIEEKIMNMVKRMGKPIQHENRFNVCLVFASIQNGQFLEAKPMIKKIVELGKRLGNPHQEANGLILEAMILIEENNFIEAIELLQIAISLSQFDDNSLKNEQLIHSLYRLSEAYIKIHKLEEAENTLNRAFDLANSTDFENPYHLANIYRFYGQIYSIRENYEKAHEYLMKSLNISQDNEIYIQEAFTQFTIGEIWLQRRKFDLARTSWQKAISKLREINNEYQVNKILPRLNSLPKPSIIIKNIPSSKKQKEEVLNPKEENMKEIPKEYEKATQIGLKLIDLISSLGLSLDSNKDSISDKEKDEIKKENKIIYDRLKRLESVSSLGQILIGDLELNSVLNTVLEKIMEITESDRGFLLLLNNRGELHSQIVKTKEGNSGEIKLLNFSKTFTEEVLKTGKSIWVSDAQADNRFSTQKSILAMDLRTVISVPLKDKAKTFGLIYLDRQSVLKTFTEDDLNLVESISGFASIAIINAKLHTQANDKNLKLQILNDLSRTISNVFTKKDLLYKVLEFALKITGAEIGYALMGEELKCEASLDLDGNRSLDLKFSSSIIKKVIETRKSISLVDTADDKTISTQASVMALDIRSVMCVPMIYNNKVLGVVYVSSRTFAKSFTNKDLELLEDIVSQTALALDNLELLEVQRREEEVRQELNIAKNIQKSMLPISEPLFDNIEISGFSESATEVGGDYYDYILLDTNKFALAFGDVTGHGVSAGLLMTMAKASLFLQCKNNPEVIPVMTALNSVILGSKTDRKLRMGFIYTVFDLDKMEFTISSAGHPLPYFYKHEIRDLEDIKVIPAYQLGVKDTIKFRETTLKLNYKDILVFFTDGLVEARSINDEEYSYERLEDFIKMNSFLSAEEIKKAIIEDYYNWIEGTKEAQDDITIVVIKVKPDLSNKPANFQKIDD